MLYTFIKMLKFRCQNASQTVSTIDVEPKVVFFCHFAYACKVIHNAEVCGAGCAHDCKRSESLGFGFDY